MRDQSNAPFKQFGEALKQLRAHAHKTAAEVSCAVEIDESILRSYENGEARPSEDILILLIAHFNLDDKKASELWGLAGYKGQPDEERYFAHSIEQQSDTMPIGIIVNDPRILYTDMVQVMTNNFGVTLTFMQTNGVGGQPLAISRIGMSKEHARSVIDLLQKTLEQAENQHRPPKMISPPHKPKE